MTFVSKSLNARYKGSFLGFLWTFINPLAQLIIYSVVFKYIFRIQEPNYTMFLFVALVPWSEFTSSINGSLVAITGNSNLVKKIYFPRQLLPLSVSLTYIVDFVYCVPILLIAMILSKLNFTTYLLFFPIIMIIQFIYQTGICYIVSALNVKFRDVQQIVGIVTMAWFYITPILYKIDMVPNNVHLFGHTINPQFYLILINPVTSMILSYRDVMLYGRLPDFTGLSIALIEGVIIFTLGYFIFKYFERTFAEDL